MTKKSILKNALIPSIGLALLTISSASAMSFGHMNFNSTATPDEIAVQQTTMFQNHATMLGLSVDEVKTAWASGKDLKTLAKEKGISLDTIKQKVEATRLVNHKTMLSALVTKGVITQAQADQRLAVMSTKTAKGGTGEGKHGGRGFGMMGW
ncbi:MAG: hypothetical protein NTW35_00885 [Candidatus Nomurabacteria bacterium]|nr:hypothetical protein [Candidatus Nomurabacteria bacterium]